MISPPVDDADVPRYWRELGLPGLVDCHVHFICPQIVPTALGSGVTTLIGGGTGPAEGSSFLSAASAA